MHPQTSRASKISVNYFPVKLASFIIVKLIPCINEYGGDGEEIPSSKVRHFSRERAPKAERCGGRLDSFGPRQSQEDENSFSSTTGISSYLLPFARSRAPKNYFSCHGSIVRGKSKKIGLFVPSARSPWQYKIIALSLVDPTFSGRSCITK